MNLELTKEECGYLIDAVLTQIEMLEHYGDPNDHMSAYTTLLEKLESLAIKG